MSAAPRRCSGCFQPAPERPAAIEVGEFVTLAYDGLEPMLREFLRAQNVEPKRIEAACFGVAGAVTGQVARLTNVPWLVEAASVEADFRLRRVRVINDLEALAYGVTVLEPSELKALQVGDALPDGNAAVIAAGTGLGEAMLHNVDGRFVPAASEGGHADFAARTPRELEMVREMTQSLRPRQRRTRRLRSRPGEHLPVHARRVRARSDAHTRAASRPRVFARVSGR